VDLAACWSLTVALGDRRDLVRRDSFGERGGLLVRRSYRQQQHAAAPRSRRAGARRARSGDGRSTSSFPDWTRRGFFVLERGKEASRQHAPAYVRGSPPIIAVVRDPWEIGLMQLVAVSKLVVSAKKIFSKKLF
jgi:hypothetical protein